MIAGGKREGAGRKRRDVPRQSLTLKLEPETMTLWRKKIESANLSGPKLLDSMLRDSQKGQRRNS